MAGVTAVASLTFGAGAALAAQLDPPHPAVEHHDEIVDLARSSGLTGLSPASLSPSPIAAYRDHPAIAAWARENGLAGLSPASLAPMEEGS